MAEKTNVPEIRFAGFTDPWEQRKLGELGSVAMCKRIFKEQTTEQGDVPFYKIGTFGGTPDAFISRELFDEYQRLYQFPKVGDILISAAGTIGRTIVYQGDPAYYQDSNIVWLQHDERLDNGFLLQFLNGKSWSSLEGSTLKRLYNKDLLNAEIAIPSPDEQHQIGSTFARLDDIITLHQRKYDKLAQLKKSMLDKMFPKPGERFPEIRFAGFTDPWEQRKFSDMYVVNNERNANCELGYDRTLSIATMTFNGGNGAADDSLSNYKVIRIGDIAFEGHTNKVHAYGRFVLNDAGDGLMSPRFSCLRPIVEQRYSFWKYYIPREESMRLILVNATKSGTMMNELVPDDLMRESILVPCLAEQEIIGNSLSQLDHLITLHQRKLELLRNTKKSLLDRMFV